MKPKNIDLANKCGSCCHFEPIEGTCAGYCLRNKYGENVVCDLEHPYWQVQRSRLKCVDYNNNPYTNADHIRYMTDEELGDFLDGIFCRGWIYGAAGRVDDDPDYNEWLKQPYKEES